MCVESEREEKRREKKNDEKQITMANEFKSPSFNSTKLNYVK